MKTVEQKNREVEEEWVKRFDNGLLVEYLEGNCEYAHVNERNPKHPEAALLSRYLQDRSYILYLVEVLNKKYKKNWNLTKMIDDSIKELKKRDVYVFLDTMFVFIRHCAFSKAKNLDYPEKVISDLNEQFKTHIYFLSNLPIEIFAVSNDYTKQVEQKIESLQIDYKFLYE